MFECLFEPNWTLLILLIVAIRTIRSSDYITDYAMEAGYWQHFQQSLIDQLMPAASRRCKKGDSCQDHTLAFRSLRTDCYYRQSLTLQLCPRLDRNGKVQANTFPVFNKDDKYYTPAFCLDIQRNPGIQTDQQFQLDHQRKVRDSMEEKRDVWIPKPSHKNRYCSTCKINYDDYLNHIRDPTHKKSIHRAKYNKHVLDFCVQIFGVQQSTIKDDRQDSTKEAEDNDEIMPSTRKLRRVQSTGSPLDKESQFPATKSRTYTQPQVQNYALFNYYQYYQQQEMRTSNMGGMGGMSNMGNMGSMSNMGNIYGAGPCFPISYNYPYHGMGMQPQIPLIFQQSQMYQYFMPQVQNRPIIIPIDDQ